MKICYDSLETLKYLGNGVWRKHGTKCYYVEKQMCEHCRQPYLTDKYNERNFCSRSCSMVGLMAGCKNPFYGKKHGHETISYLSKINSGINSPNYGRRINDSVREKLSLSKLGDKNPFFGKTHSEKTKKIISNKVKGINHPNWGKHLSKEIKLKISNSRKGKLIGKSNHNWRGGISPLRQSFYKSDTWKKVCSFVWKRDKAMCQRCGEKYISNIDKFHVHHIVSFEVEKLRADKNNLILLCPECHVWVHSNANKTNKFLCFVEEGVL